MPKGKSNTSSSTPEPLPQGTEFTFVVQGRPTPKGRPRMTRRGRVYTPQTTLEAEDAIVAAIPDDAPIFNCAVQMEITFTKDSTSVTIRDAPDWVTNLRGDIDNYVKLLMYGIQKAGIIPNDKQVVHVDAVKI